MKFLSILKRPPPQEKSVFDEPTMIGIFFFLFALLIRFPFCFDYEIDWDESTFVLIAQDLLNGRLPYTHLWILKPPLVFLPYALFIFLFGKSIIAIRALGFLCVVSTALIVWVIGRRFYDRITAFWAGVLCIVLTSIAPGSQPTMTEHLAIVPLSLAILVLLKKKYDGKDALNLGVLVALACLIRLNAVYIGFIIGVILCYREYKKGTPNFIKSASHFLLGAAAPFLLVILIYAVNGQLNLLFRSIIPPALSYSTEGRAFSFYERILFYGKEFYALVIWCFAQHQWILWLTSFLGMCLMIFGMKGKQRTANTIIILVFIFSCVSVASMGRGYGHYVILLFPTMALMGGLFIAAISRTKPQWLSLTCVVLAFGLLLSPLSIKYRYMKNTSSANWISKYLSMYQLSDEYVFFCIYPISYWFTGAKIPTKYVHPADIGSDYFIKAIDGPNATPEQELKNILEKRPLFIVKPLNVSYFTDAQKNILDSEIRQNYRVETFTLEKPFEPSIYFYMRNDIQLFSENWWNKLSRFGKKQAVEGIIRVLKETKNIAILKSPQFYQEKIDIFLSQARHDSLSIPALVQWLAKQEHDFYSGTREV